MKRLLSFIVAIAMIAGLVTCFAITSSADVVDAETATGFEAAYADFMAYLEGMPDINHNCNDGYLDCIAAGVPEADRTGVFQTALQASYERYLADKTQQNINYVCIHVRSLFWSGEGMSIFKSSKLEEVGDALSAFATTENGQDCTIADYLFPTYKIVRAMLSNISADIFAEEFLAGKSDLSDFMEGNIAGHSTDYYSTFGGSSGAIAKAEKAIDAWNLWTAAVDYVNENLHLKAVVEAEDLLEDLKAAAATAKVDGELISAEQTYTDLCDYIEVIETALNGEKTVYYSDINAVSAATLAKERMTERAATISSAVDTVIKSEVLDIYNSLDDVPEKTTVVDQKVVDTFNKIITYLEGVEDLKDDSDNDFLAGLKTRLEAYKTNPTKYLWCEDENAGQRAKQPEDLYAVDDDGDPIYDKVRAVAPYYELEIYFMGDWLCNGKNANKVFWNDEMRSLLRSSDKYANFCGDSLDMIGQAKPYVRSLFADLAIDDVTNLFVEGKAPKDVDVSDILEAAHAATTMTEVMAKVKEAVARINANCKLKSVADAEAALPAAKAALAIKRVTTAENEDAELQATIEELEGYIATTGAGFFVKDDARPRWDDVDIPENDGFVKSALSALAINLEAYNELPLADADYSALNTALAAARALNADHYVDFSAVAEQITSATALIAENLKSDNQERVDAAVAALNAAISGLTMKSADTAALDKAIDDAKALNADDYTNYGDVAAAVAAAEALKAEDPKISDQERVNAAVKAINDAVAALVEKTADDGNNNKPAEGDNNTPAGDDNKPADGNDGNQNTGDAMTALYMTMFFISLAGIVTVVTLKIKNRA